MKRLLVAVTLAVSLASGTGAAAAAPVSVSASGALQTLTAQGVMAGGSGVAAVSQGQLAAILLRLHQRDGVPDRGLPPPWRNRPNQVVTRGAGLIEVLDATGRTQARALPVVERVAERGGLLVGMPGIVGAPSLALTREQLAVLLVRIEGPAAAAGVAVSGAGPTGVTAPGTPTAPTIATGPAIIEGTLTAVSAVPGGTTSLTVATPSGSHTVAVAADAQVELDGNAATATQLASGQIVQLAVASTGQAQVIFAFAAGTTPVAPLSVAGTVTNVANGQITVQPLASGSSPLTYTLAANAVVSAGPTPSASSNVTVGDRVQVHVFGQTAVWLDLTAAAGAASGTLTATAPGGFILTASDGTTVRVVVPAKVSVAVGSVILPRGALATGEVVTVNGVSRSGRLVATSVSITGDAVSGQP